MNERYIDLLGHYYRNPKDVQRDYRKYSASKEVSEEAMKYSVEWADKILKVIEDHFGKAFGNLEKIDESSFVEGKMLDKKDKKDLAAEKSSDSGVLDAQLKKIAGLVNKKLDQKDINKLINLLEAE